MTLPNPNWSHRSTGTGQEIEYRVRQGQIPVIAACAAFMALCVYFASVFLVDWFISGAEVLPGGVICCALLLGGAFLGFCGIAHLLRRVTYRLEPNRLLVTIAKPGRRSERTFERGYIESVLRLYTPPKSAGLDGTYRTMLSLAPLAGSPKSLVLEGDKENEQAWLAEIFSEWSGKPCKDENTSL